jgi:sugar O-acyltransferase (sialic acid O-acetyltransferase NeuD family)
MHAAQADGRPVVVIGAGENAEIAYEYFTHDSPRAVVGFAVEEGFLSGEDDRLYDLPVVPLQRVGDHFPPGDHDAFVAISSTELNRVRMRLYAHVKEAGYSCASYVSSRAFVWHNVTIGENTFVFEHNVLQHHVSVGDNVVLWSGNHIGHRASIQDHCFISSHVVISGYCDIGESSFLGVNACLADGTKIGRDCVVGAGAVVVRDTEPRGVYVGNPARATGRDAFQTFKVHT